MWHPACQACRHAGPCKTRFTACCQRMGTMRLLRASGTLLMHPVAPDPAQYISAHRLAYRLGQTRLQEGQIMQVIAVHPCFLLPLGWEGSQGGLLLGRALRRATTPTFCSTWALSCPPLPPCTYDADNIKTFWRFLARNYSIARLPAGWQPIINGIFRALIPPCPTWYPRSRWAARPARSLAREPPRAGTVPPSLPAKQQPMIPCLLSPAAPPPHLTMQMGPKACWQSCQRAFSSACCPC